MWTVCITPIRHVLKLNGYGGPQAKVNEKSQGFKGWETLVINSQTYKLTRSQNTCGGLPFIEMFTNTQATTNIFKPLG